MFSKIINGNITYSLKIVINCNPIYVLWKIIVAAYEGIINLVGLLMLRNILNSISSNSDYISSIASLVIFCLIIMISQIAIRFVDAKVAPSFFCKLKKRVSLEMFEKAKSVDLVCYEDRAYYDKYCVAMTHAYDKCCEVLSDLTALIEAVTTFIASGIFTLFIDPLVIPFAFLPFCTLVLRNKKNKIMHNQNQNVSKINRQKSYVIRTFYQNTYAKEMRTTNIHQPLLERFNSASDNIKEVYKTHGVKAAWIWIIESFLNLAFSEYAVLIYVAWCVLARHTMQYGDCLILVGAAQGIYDSINGILECLSNFQDHSLYINDLREFLKYEPKIKRNPEGKKAVAGDIVLHNVSFRYLGSDKNALNNVNLHIKKGEKVALVGYNGAGKTTLIKLLLRLYDPTEGQILLNGTDYKDLELQSLRDCYSVVLQDYKHFSISVKDNIALGDIPDDKLINSAIEKSGLYQRVLAMENCVDTILDKEIDDKGEILSGGEQQKLAIARIYYKGSDIVILDEPASALDPIAEHDLYKRMMALSADKTVIFVSHRLSSTLNADRIIYLENGSVAECNNHSELMRLNGKYANMFRIQAENYITD